MNMVLLRTIISYQKTFAKWPLTLYSREYYSCLKTNTFSFRKFYSSPVKQIRNKLEHTSKPKVESLEPQIEGLVIETGNLELSKLLRPFVFTVAFSSASLAAAAIWEYENIHTRRKQLREWFHEKRKYGKWRNEISRWWNGLTEGQRIFAPICFLNILVFMAWKVPSFQPAMVKYFCSNPAAKSVCWPMVLSTFSHYSVLHIFANMYVLHSFSSGCVAVMGKEQFVGFYMAAGAIASLASYVHKVVVNRPGLSLGASGAIMGVLSYTCMKFPDIELSLIFLPFLTFKAGAAIKVIIGIDALGVLLGWRFFDHAAHLGGALFGIFWSSFGSEYLWKKSGPIVEAWYNIRGPLTKD